MVEPQSTPQSTSGDAVTRRSLLLGASAAVGMTLPDVAANRTVLTDASDAAERRPAYRETEHIRTFYERSRF
jgi:hypothetical protein